MDVTEMLKDFVGRALIGKMPESIFIHPSDLVAVGRKILGTIFDLHPDLMPNHMEEAVSGPDSIFFGKRIVEHVLGGKIGIEPAFAQQKGRAKLYYSDGSEREIKI